MTDAFGSDPVSSFYQQEQSSLSSGNQLQQLLGQLGGSQAGTLSSGQIQAALAGEQYNLGNAEFALGNQYNQQLAGYQLGQLGIQGQQLGLQGQGLQAEAGLLGTTTAVERQEYGLQQSQYPEQRAEAALNYQNNQSNLVGNEASKGALNTRGSSQQQDLLAKNYQWQSQDINRAQGLSQLQQTSTEAQQQYSAQSLSIAQKNLGLLAQSNGLSQQEVLNQLNYGIAQSGLSQQQNPIQLLSSLDQIYQGDLTGLNQALSSIGFAGGLNLAPGG